MEKILFNKKVGFYRGITTTVPWFFPSHTGKVFHIKIVCLVRVVFEYIFSAYILLYFLVSYKFTQRGSFLYRCFSQHSGIRARCDRAPLSDYYSVKYLVLNYGG
jgi:hypothetical protein